MRSLSRLRDPGLAGARFDLEEITVKKEIGLTVALRRNDASRHNDPVLDGTKILSELTVYGYAAALAFVEKRLEAVQVGFGWLVDGWRGFLARERGTRLDGVVQWSGLIGFQFFEYAFFRYGKGSA